MSEDRDKTLTDSLFTLVDSLNTALDHLDSITERHEKLINENDEVFTKMREEFWRKVIEIEVNKEIEKSKQSTKKESTFGSDIIRQARGSGG